MDLKSIKDKFSDELTAHISEGKGRQKRYSASFKKAVTSCLRGGVDRQFLCSELKYSAGDGDHLGSSRQS